MAGSAGIEVSLSFQAVVSNCSHVAQVNQQDGREVGCSHRAVASTAAPKSEVASLLLVEGDPHLPEQEVEPGLWCYRGSEELGVSAAVRGKPSRGLGADMFARDEVVAFLYRHI